ncbi:MAG: hypothetical protein C4297_03210 [Gemmataceae bacterium]
MHQVGDRFDIWVVRTNALYRGVPYAVVADWIVQGRLLPEDRVSISGQDTWATLEQTPHFAAYLGRPRTQQQPEDEAEALEEVGLGLEKHSAETAEDDDPDMIPLIDISMVLLVFFMMTASGFLVTSPIETPVAENARIIESAQAMSIGITYQDGQLRYFYNDQMNEPLSEKELLERVREDLKQGRVKPEAIIRANPKVPYETVLSLLTGLEKLNVRMKAGVTGKAGSGEGE